MKKRWLLAVGAAAAVVVLGAGAVMAQDDGANGTSFLDRVAQKLGIDRSNLDQAIRDARNDEIDERVAQGDLTQEQADRLREKLDSLPEDAPFGGLGRFRGPGVGPLMRFHIGGLAAWGAQDELAEFLGITIEQLREQLQADGATLASVAEANGKSRDELKSFIEQTAKTKLDERVAAGDLTQERADAMLSRITENLDEIIDAPGGLCRGFGFGKHFDDGEEAPSEDGQQQSGVSERIFRS